ncbi:PRC-barrel domain-containing protein [Pseudanabaena sp. PCC 6802]|uniref:PRC-barrel domain-containing protein n=1 Tax=Pseudanabaena sp. PCC 6802 TaxID=118173 RepID=UPI000345E91A|nr:hypothetical protein [Pseudanabaena sp. PCC 6802]
MHDRSEPYYYNSSLLYTNLVGREVCTDEAVLLGWVSGTCLDENTNIRSIIIVPLNSQLIPARFLSTYKLHSPNSGSDSAMETPLP